ncbi:MAG: hypothetical protein K9K35_00240 [Rhodoferax sp.]|nr:hypothetical protein [Rhodoferax sp.]
MNVHLTFDIEVWCDGWDALDATFPASFERYVYAKSAHGSYALPMTLEILERHGLTGVFFVEPLFAARFGLEYLRTVVQLIRVAGHSVQLHLHPEWVDEIRPALIANNATKRQHLTYYTVQEQTALIAYGRSLLEQAGSGSISVFRAGSFAANRGTFEALRCNGILIDSSLNSCYSVSGADIRDQHALNAPFTIHGVRTYPVTVFSDGFGRSRPAHVGACSFLEMRDAMRTAAQSGASDFVVVSHNFEMLKPGGVQPSRIVVRRFQQLCAYLALHRDELPVTGFEASTEPLPSVMGLPVKTASAMVRSTLRRHVEQLLCRIG